MSLAITDTILLNLIPSATTNDVSFQTEAAIEALYKEGLVEFNALVKDAEGRLACRRTAKGDALVAQGVAPKQEEVAPAVAETVAIAPQTKKIVMGSGGFVPPAKASRRRGPSGRSYPWESLAAVGDYFFVATPEGKKSPVTSSTLTGANKRFEDYQPRRCFKAYRATKGQVFGSVVAESDGTFVVRVEPPVA